MNWDAVGALAEVIGAITVVITLVYVAAEIRQNTKSNRNVALQTISTQNADWLSLITQDEGVARLFRVGQQDPQELSDDERVRYGMLMTQFFRVFDTQFYQYKTKVLPEEFWQSSVRSMQAILRRKGARMWWTKYGAQMTLPFQQFLDDLIQ